MKPPKQDKAVRKIRLSNSLQNEIDAARSEIKTDAYAMSIGEWASLYENREIDIHPEFQRFFRWTSSQKSRFIESILLGIPVPPIFVAQSEEGIWDVVDGLQRLSTLFEFMGILRNEEERVISPLVLEATKYLTSLEGKTWDDADSSKNNSFTASQRLFIKRSKLDVSIILRESQEKAKYELFQRLNTGGSQLSDQEVRNCIIVMLDRDFFYNLRSLASDENFANCVSLTDKVILEQYDMELALRFIVFRKMKETKLSQIRDLGEFLTDEMVDLIKKQKIDWDTETDVFRKTFTNIATLYGPDVFRRYDPSKKRHAGGFLLSAFEVVAIGIAFYDGEISDSDSDFRKKVKAMWSKAYFKQWSGSGVRASSRIPKLVPLGRKIFAA